MAGWCATRHPPHHHCWLHVAVERAVSRGSNAIAQHVARRSAHTHHQPAAQLDRGLRIAPRDALHPARDTLHHYCRDRLIAIPCSLARLPAPPAPSQARLQRPGDGYVRVRPWWRLAARRRLLAAHRPCKLCHAALPGRGRLDWPPGATCARLHLHLARTLSPTPRRCIAIADRARGREMSSQNAGATPDGGAAAGLDGEALELALSDLWM